jgi:hypothetical protein
MVEVSDSLGYAPVLQTHRSKKLDKVAEYFRRLDEIREKATEKFRDVKDYCKNNKRQTVYVVATLGSGITGYALTGHPLMGTSCAVVAGSASMIHNTLKEVEEERIAREKH